MKFSEYISQTSAFTTEAAANATGSSSLKTLLSRAQKSGKIVSVRRGLYASKTGLFFNKTTEPYDIVNALDSDAVLVYHSALEALGVAHNVFSNCQFRTCAIAKEFVFEGTTYEPFPTKEIDGKRIRYRQRNFIYCTSKEQTILDCLSHPNYAGGIEEVIRSLSLFSYVDVDKLIELCPMGNKTVAARLGWFLEKKVDAWRVDQDALIQLKEQLGKGPYRLDGSSKNQGWCPDWQLLFPESIEEVETWIFQA